MLISHKLNTFCTQMIKLMHASFTTMLECYLLYCYNDINMNRVRKNCKRQKHVRVVGATVNTEWKYAAVMTQPLILFKKRHEILFAPNWSCRNSICNIITHYFKYKFDIRVQRNICFSFLIVTAMWWQQLEKQIQ